MQRRSSVILLFSVYLTLTLALAITSTKLFFILLAVLERKVRLFFHTDRLAFGAFSKHPKELLINDDS
jgi:hypothetical protein